jgi:Secretion system C-terminal sorting domain
MFLGGFYIYCFRVVKVLEKMQPMFIRKVLSSYLADKLNVTMKQTLLVLSFFVAALALQGQSLSHQPDLTVYPNPATEFFSVNDQNDLAAHICVFNIMGRKVREFEFVKGERYNISDLSKGFYMVQIQDKNKKPIVTNKLEKR